MTAHDCICTDRAMRLLAGGHVTIFNLSEHRIDAYVQGNTDRRRVTRTPDGWTCDCPGWQFRHRCAHVDAVRIVVTVRQGTP